MDINNQSAAQKAARYKASLKVLEILGLVIAGFYLLGPITKVVREFSKDRDLAKYDQPIQECVRQKEATYAEPVVGLDYECAISVAAGIYAQSPDEAVRLCLKYQIGTLKESSPLLAEALCKSQIQEAQKK